jgi:hypothetical protein
MTSEARAFSSIVIIAKYHLYSFYCAHVFYPITFELKLTHVATGKYQFHGMLDKDHKKD